MLLQACLLPGSAATDALRRWRAENNLDSIDLASSKILALLFRRHGEQALDRDLHARAYVAYCTTWQNNQKRLLSAATLIRDLNRAGVRALLMKGAALSIRHYRDAGVRPMDDVDVLVPRESLRPAVEALERAGWQAEGGFNRDDVIRRSRVMHAWQFERGQEHADLHWNPVLRCFSPEVAGLFWASTEAATLFGKQILIPSPADLLFHACAHGLQWSWTPQIRWIPDAISISSGPVDWERIAILAEKAEMSVRLHRGLRYLRNVFQAPIPESLLARLENAGGAHEVREYDLLQRECPLGFADRVHWHVSNFRRIRRFDSNWRHRFGPVSFAEYLLLFPKLSAD
ncbi:MAG: nucleotidyltransferase family protein [Bryobacteraceae bacterium]